MLTIAVPMAGSSSFYPEADNTYPKLFREVLGKPMIQAVVENLMTIDTPKRFIFIVNQTDVSKFKLDNVLQMLTNNQCDIVVQTAPTKGAVCSLLLAVKSLNHDTPLLITNSDQIIDHDLNEIVNYFLNPNLDGAVVCFDSVHPQWSYAGLVNGDQLAEAAEKQPISRNAIAGMYFFKKGTDFIQSSINSILKDRNYMGKYYTSSVLNEMILENKNLKIFNIKSTEYHSFYTPEKIGEYEQMIKDNKL